jgi:hypothetical protein
MQRLLARIQLQIEPFLLHAAYALGTRMAATTAFSVCTIIRPVLDAAIKYKLTLRVAHVFVLVLVFLLATVALGVMRLGLARAAAVLALLDRTTLRVDVM